MRIFCLCHLPPVFPLPKDTCFIGMGDYRDFPAGYHVSEIADELDALHPFLAGASGAFAIARILKRINASDGRICLMLHRKFIAPHAFGNPAPNYPGMFMLDAAAAAQIDFTALAANVHTPYLLAQPVRVGNLYRQFASVHKISDLLRYVAIAVELGVLTPEESSLFFSDDTLIPCGVECGIFPTEVFLTIIEKLERVCVTFLRSHMPSSFDSYNRRALDFCNERLGSFLLKRVLLSSMQEIPAQYFGYMHTVGDTQKYVPGGMPVKATQHKPYGNMGKSDHESVATSTDAWDEQAYVAANPDIAEAIARGQIKSGYQHYVTYGRKEGRPINVKPHNGD